MSGSETPYGDQPEGRDSYGGGQDNKDQGDEPTYSFSHVAEGNGGRGYGGDRGGVEGYADGGGVYFRSGYGGDGGGGYSGGGYVGSGGSTSGSYWGHAGGGRGGRGGGHRDGDWVCPNASCGNVNFARRAECNKCSTPKPFGSSQSSGPISSYGGGGGHGGGGGRGNRNAGYGGGDGYGGGYKQGNNYREQGGDGGRGGYRQGNDYVNQGDGHGGYKQGESCDNQGSSQGCGYKQAGSYDNQGSTGGPGYRQGGAYENQGGQGYKQGGTYDDEGGTGYRQGDSYDNRASSGGSGHRSGGNYSNQGGPGGPGYRQGGSYDNQRDGGSSGFRLGWSYDNQGASGSSNYKQGGNYENQSTGYRQGANYNNSSGYGGQGNVSHGGDSTGQLCRENRGRLESHGAETGSGMYERYEESEVKVKQCDVNCGDDCDNSRIYISGLPLDSTIEELQELFGGIGTVGRIKQKRGYKDQWPWNIKIYKDESGQAKGDAVLSYDDPSAAHSAGSFFNDYSLRGHQIKVTMAEKSAPRPSGAGYGQGHGGERGGGPERRFGGGHRSRPY